MLFVNNNMVCLTMALALSRPMPDPMAVAQINDSFYAFPSMAMAQFAARSVQSQGISMAGIVRMTTMIPSVIMV
jgi:hypothetical protein